MDAERRGNFFTRAWGIEAYRRWTDNPLYVNGTPFEFLARVDRVRGVIGGVVHFSGPLTERFLAEHSSSFRRFAFSSGFDLASIAAFYFAAVNVDMLTGGLAKLAYNLCVEIEPYLPDALRAVRNYFHMPSSSGSDY